MKIKIPQTDGELGMKKSRIQREKEVLRKMVNIYCVGHAHSNNTCENCRQIIEYAELRLDACKFGENKVFCSKCTVHCYNTEMRISIKKIMRYSGPRMLFHDPIIALKHILQK